MENQILEMLKSMDSKFDKIDKRLDGIDKRLDGIDKRLDGIDKRLDKVEQRLDKVEQRLDGVEQRQDEMYTILRGMEEKFETNKAEHDRMSVDIAEIKGDVKTIRKDLSQVEMVTANNWADIAKLKAIK